MHPRKFIRDSVGFAATQYLVRAMLMLRGIIAARLLGPASYGAWNALQLMMDYGVFAPLGTQHGLDQAVPARLVEGDAPRIERLERAGLFNILVLTGIFVAGCVLFALHSTGRMLQFWGASGILAALVCVALTNVAFYHLTLLRSHGNFTAVNGWFFIQSLVGATLGVGLVPSLGAWGLLWGWLAGTAVAMVYTRWQARSVAPLLPAPSRDGLTLVRVGFPMFLYMGSSLVMRSLDRLIILRFLGTLALGYYSLSVMALTFLLYLPDSVSYVLYPQLLRRFREGENRPEVIRDRVERVMTVLAGIVPALCGVAYLCAREAVLALLPRFLPGVGSMRILCFAAGGLALTSLSSIVLMTLGRQLALVPAALFGMLLGATLDYLAVRRGLGITGVAWATLVTYSVNGALLLTLSLFGLGHSLARALRGVVRAMLPLALSLGVAYGLDRLLPWYGPRTTGLRLLRLLVGLVGFVSLYSLAVFPLMRGTGVRQLLLEFNLPGRGLLRRFGRRAQGRSHF